MLFKCADERSSGWTDDQNTRSHGFQVQALVHIRAVTSLLPRRPIFYQHCLVSVLVIMGIFRVFLGSNPHESIHVKIAWKCITNAQIQWKSP